MNEAGESTQTQQTGSPGLERLQQRLDALQSSVERLGTDQWTPSAPPAPPLPSYAAPAPSYAPPPAYPSAEPADPYGAAPVYAPPPPYVPPPAAAAPPLPPAPAVAEPAAPALPIAVITVGPFPDLIELRHFEEALAAQEAVHDVHVRRFGLGWAEVEVGLVADYPIAGELQRLGRPMKFEVDPNGQLVVEFTDLTPEAVAEAQSTAPDMEAPALTQAAAEEDEG